MIFEEGRGANRHLRGRILDDPAERARRPRPRFAGLENLVLVLATTLAAACGSSITSPPESVSLLDPLQPRSEAPVVTITGKGVAPQVLHLNAPVTVSFTNDDQAAHKIEAAPELRYDDCPEFSQLKTVQPGQTSTVTISRTNLICAYHDAAGPSDVNFQGLVVLH
jgi:hypothetical protein